MWKPYVYCISNLESKEFYIGVRFSVKLTCFTEDTKKKLAASKTGYKRFYYPDGTFVQCRPENAPQGTSSTKPKGVL